MLRSRSRKRKTLLAGVCVFLVALNAFLWYIGVYGGNVHTVIPGVLYRSAQLSGGTLEREIGRDHIRSIIDLRGASPDAADYRSEISISKRLGVDHDDVGLSAHRLPSPADVRELIKDWDTMPKPILIHCKAGSDRTGLVATLFVAIQPGADLSQAEQQELTWRYGHFAAFGTQAMNDFFDLYRKTGAGQSLRDWCLGTYPTQYEWLQKVHSWEVSPGPGHE